MKYSHPCRYAEFCRNPEEHFTHEPHLVPYCKYEKCRKLGDPMHRSKFLHMNLPYFLIPCRDQPKCSNSSEEHRIKYSHGEEVCQTTSTTNHNDQTRPKPCKGASNCQSIKDEKHSKKYSHPLDTQQ